MPRHAHFPPYIASINCNYCGGNYCISCSIVYSNEYNDLVLYCVNLQSETKPEPGLHSMLEVIHLMLVPHLFVLVAFRWNCYPSMLIGAYIALYASPSSIDYRLGQFTLNLPFPPAYKLPPITGFNFVRKHRIVALEGAFKGYLFFVETVQDTGEKKISFLGNSIKGNFHFRLDKKLPKKEILMAGIIGNGDSQMDCFGHVTFQKRKFFDEMFFDLGKQICLFGK